MKCDADRLFGATLGNHHSRPVHLSSAIHHFTSSDLGCRTIGKFLSASTPSAIISAIRPAFEKGKASGDLLFFPSQVHVHKDLGVDVGSTQHFPPRPHISARISDNDSFCMYYY